MAGGFRHDIRAAAAVEFALIAPVFILMITGISAYAVYFGASHSLQQIAADAARIAVAGTDAAERETMAAGYITRNSGGYPFIDPANLTFDMHDGADGAFVVAVDYDARDLPIWALLRDLPLPDTTIRRRSVIRIGGL